MADMALEWAEGCHYEHGQPNNTSEYDPIGQNLYITTGNLNVERAITAWYVEINDYTFETRTCAEGAVCGHYTQLVWDNTDVIGCAHTFCATLTGIDDFDGSNYVVCNYGPA